VLRIIGGGRFIVELSAALILSVCFCRSLFFFLFFLLEMFAVIEDMPWI